MDTELHDFLKACEETGTDPYNAIWTIFDARLEAYNPWLHEAMTRFDPRTAAIPIPVLEALTVLLPPDATNSTFDSLLWDCEDLEEYAGKGQ